MRNSQKVTYILPSGCSYRVASANSNHQKFLKKFGYFYSTSANKTGEKFENNWAKNRADVVVFEPCGFQELKSSKIIKLTKIKQKGIR